MDAQAILDRFDAVTEYNDGGYIARCSAHSDSSPSLRIWVDDTKIRLTCRAGCDTSDVISAVGLKWSDLFEPTGDVRKVKPGGSKLVGPGEVAALRMFLDAHPIGPSGVRYAHETFGLSFSDIERLELGQTEPGEGFTNTGSRFSRFPRLLVPFYDSKGVARGLQGRDISGDCPDRWMSLTNPEGLHWSRYGYLPAASDTDICVVTEGPSDGLTVVGAGYSALIVRGAALASNEALSAEIAEVLKGNRVYVAGDNDRAGNIFSVVLSRSLADHGINVYRLTVPTEGGDIKDWRLSSPATFPAELYAAMRKAEKVTVSADPSSVPPSTDEAKEAARIVEVLYPQYGLSDVMRAHALVQHSGNAVRYSPEMGFFVWDGTVWVRSENRVRTLVHQMGASLHATALSRGETGGKDDFFSKAASGCTSSRAIDSLVRELKAVPGVMISFRDLDNKPDLLNFANGTVDLRTGELRPHDPEDLLTQKLPVDYDPEAKAPRWEQCLHEVMPNHPEMVDYLRRLIGYGITGHTSEQCFAVLHGKGANGKSLVLDTLSHSLVFGGYSRVTSFATFEEKPNGGIPNDVAALRGSRLVLASEGEAGKYMAEGTIKKLTGDATINARFLRQEFFEFAPTFLVLLATNHKPKFKGQDEGLWRRVKLIPFNRYFAPDERDYDLPKKLIAEAPGIIAWAVRGAVEWYRDGLQDPEAVISATAEYRETSDSLAGFLGDIVEVTKDDADKMLGKDLFNSYLDWCEAENLPNKERWRRNTFFSAMEERGAQKFRAAGGMSFRGIRLVTPDVPQMEETGDIFGD